MRRLFLKFLLGIIVAAFPLGTKAGDNDIQISRLNYYDYDHCGWRTPEEQEEGFVCILKPNGQELFKSLVTELGIVMSPKMLATADTLGEAGFEFGLATSFTTIKNKLAGDLDKPIEVVKAVLRGHDKGSSVCRHDVLGFSTVLSWIAVPQERRFLICEGFPCENEYRAYNLKN